MPGCPNTLSQYFPNFFYGGTPKIVFISRGTPPIKKKYNKTKRQFVEHEDYSGTANCRPNFPAVS
jgi:hypothetical protein